MLVPLSIRGAAAVALFAAAAACNNTPSAAPPANDSTQVTVLARPSETAVADWDAAAPPPSATSANDDGTPSDSTATPAGLKSMGPGTYVVDGYVVRSQQCPPCPPGAHCKPCELAIYISAQAPSGSGDPPDTTSVRVSDSTSYAPGARYRFVVTITQSANQSTRRLFSATPR